MDIQGQILSNVFYGVVSERASGLLGSKRSTLPVVIRDIELQIRCQLLIKDFLRL